MVIPEFPFTESTSIVTNWYRNEPYYSTYHQNCDFKSGDIMAPAEVNITFDYSEATGSALNIEVMGEVDQVRFRYIIDEGDYTLIEWYHYFDPENLTRFDLPALGSNVDIQEIYHSNTVLLEDYDNFDGSKEIVDALFKKNNWATSWDERHFTYLDPYPSTSARVNAINENKNKIPAKGQSGHFVDKRHGIYIEDRQTEKYLQRK